MTFFQKTSYFLLSALLRLLGFMPLGVHRFLGRILGRLAGSVIKYRRREVEANLLLAFPEKSPEERDQIRKDYYRHLGTIICEAIWFGACTRPQRLARANTGDVQGQEILNEYYSQGKSVVVLTSHTGNFEMYGGLFVFAAQSEPLIVPENNVCVVFRALSSPVWNEIIKKNRIAPLLDKKHYDAMVETNIALRYALKRKGDAMLFNFITDQYPYSEYANAKVTFFGKQTISMIGGITLARKYSMPIVYMYMAQRPQGGYTMRFSKMYDDPSAVDTQQIADEYYRRLEDDIRSQPANYLWSHRRWK